MSENEELPVPVVTEVVEPGLGAISIKATGIVDWSGLERRLRDGEIDQKRYAEIIAGSLLEK